jgi:hypothetical protein
MNKLPIPEGCIAINHEIGLCIIEYYEDFFAHYAVKLMEWVKPVNFLFFKLGGYWRTRQNDFLGINRYSWAKHYKMEKIV